MSVVRNYSEALDSESSLVGGKGWSIARLARANIPVPEGFCITRDLIAGILKNNTRLEKAYTAYLERVDSTGVSDGRMSDQMRGTMHEVPIEANTLSELRAALGASISTSSDRIIVRSSASIEDNRKTSFAGQFGSTVTRNDLEDLLQAVRECWQAVLSPSLAAYAFAVKVRLAGLSLGFVVQEFLDCDYGGVLFTQWPGLRDRDDYVVEYARGGAQNIVSGRGIPGRCLLKGGKHSVEWLKRAPEARGPSEDVLLELGRLAGRCRQLFQSEQDIEWGVIGARVFLLQSRPVTA